MDEAVKWTTRFLQVLGKGECELRPIFEASDFPAEVFSSNSVRARGHGAPGDAEKRGEPVIRAPSRRVPGLHRRI
jgi:hypothetical protein